MMKKIISAAFILLAIFLCTDQNFARPNSGPKFEFLAENNRLVLDTIYLDWTEEVQFDVEFINKGDQPLVVFNVTGCCGTQITGWTQQPVLPGEKGSISVEFRIPPRPHRISRTVKAQTNDPEGAKTLDIIGVVAEPKEEGTIDLQRRAY
ncbi:MAG: DUF1573 domain-containing protein [Bacteroidales bacterium]|jgi:hypothetical protein|nr:DUF1573 domain-containing protein [Bacteroidales bacterium]